MAAIISASGGRGYFSKFVMADAVLEFYKKHQLYPAGLNERTAAVQEWAMKSGTAMARLAFQLHVRCLVWFHLDGFGSACVT